MTQTDDPLTIYYDGACPLCRMEIAHYQSRDTDRALRLVDVAATGGAPADDLDRAMALRRFHVRDAQGNLLSGARAFVAVWDRLPGWRWAARLARIPGALALLELGYRGFLPLRPLIARLATQRQGH